MPIVLGTFVLSSHIPAGETIFNAVFFVVVVSALVQGTTLELVAGVSAASRSTAADAEPAEQRSLESLDLVPYDVGGGHAIAGAAVRELGCRARL